MADRERQDLAGVEVRSRTGWQEVPQIQQAIAEARATVGKPEWLSVRASGTEPLIRVMVQDTDATHVESTVTTLCALIQRHCGE